MGPYDGVDYNSPYLIVKSVVSYPVPPQKERGGIEQISPIGWAHWYHLLISKTTNWKIEKGEGREGKGREGVRADLMSLNIHFMEHKQPHAWADFNPMP